ncbi:MAG TPA: branched-chain-amino-acid transaminase [bacterium]|nr:branched-chain-amino-acid transaminase [bacterium]HOL47988.1 branched-chain-amino-acid transaminase [bacterium]HPQ18586.1 branched-chain-amino-acid transaminase [bacterium]
MGLQIYIDGKFVDESEAKISVFDHGLLYGDGVFEGIRVYDNGIFELEAHLERLYDSAKAINLKIEIPFNEMIELHCEAVRRNKIKDGYIRTVITRGKGDLGLDPRKCPKPTIFIIAATITLYPPEFYEKGLKIMTVSTRRNRPDVLSPRIKSLNYLNNIIAKIEATNAGCLEAIMLNTEGYVAECTGDNIFYLKKNKIYTPPTYLGALEGITRNSIINILHNGGIDVIEKPFTLYELYTAEEVFLTGTAAEVVPIVEIDARQIGNGKPGKFTKQIIANFKEYVKKHSYPVYK